MLRAQHYIIYTTLYYTILHNTTLHNSTLHYTTLYYTTLFYATCTTLHYLHTVHYTHYAKYISNFTEHQVALVYKIVSYMWYYKSKTNVLTSKQILPALCTSPGLCKLDDNVANLVPKYLPYSFLYTEPKQFPKPFPWKTFIGCYFARKSRSTLLHRLQRPAPFTASVLSNGVWRRDSVECHKWVSLLHGAPSQHGTGSMAPKTNIAHALQC